MSPYPVRISCNMVLVSSGQYLQLWELAMKYANGRLGVDEYVRLALAVCPKLKAFHDNRLIVDPIL